MSRYEYMKIDLDIVPDEIIRQYNLRALASNGWFIWKYPKECQA